MRVIPIASGKGGVGKTLFAVNIAISLAEVGNRVVLVDLDLGASNAHTVLGLRSISVGIGNYFSDSSLKIDDLLLDTEYEGLKFIAGEGEIPGLANLKSSQKNKLISNLFKIDADYLILDLGAGSGVNTLDFCLMSSEPILICTPNLTSVLNSYMFLKSAVFRIMFLSFKKGTPARKYFDSLIKEGNSLQKVYIIRLLENIKKKDKDSYDIFMKRFDAFKPKMVMNMIEDPKDAIKGQKLKISTKQYLGVDLDHYGVIYRDHLQDIALSSRLPIIRYKKDCVISQAIYRIAEKIEQSTPGEYGTFGVDDIEENYQIAENEAELDFDTRSQEMKNLLNTGVLTQGDLMETIRTQQYEIKSLKQENALLKKKIVKAINDGFKI